jgi:hypothetical protein
MVAIEGENMRPVTWVIVEEVQSGDGGSKAWALLAVLLLADRPVSRRSVTGLLVPDADDPLGAALDAEPAAARPAGPPLDRGRPGGGQARA